MRAPEFWYRNSPGVRAALLSPLGMIYAGIVAARIKRGPARPSEVPVICVGNIMSGGTGKTPVALAIAEKLQQRSLDPHFLTRGYGGTTAGPLRVDLQTHTAAEVGDEALLLASLATTWVAADRFAGAQEAVAAGADAIIMDDGFQNPGLRKDLSFIVFDGTDGLGNGRYLPAGPLRESLPAGLARADAAVIIGRDETQLARRLGNKALHANLIPAPESQALRGRKVVGFAGIGRPRKFFDTLRDLGCELAECHPFADHHDFREDELTALKERAQKFNAQLVTTSKDAARLPKEFRSHVTVVPITLIWDDEEKLDQLLDAVLRGRDTPKV